MILLLGGLELVLVLRNILDDYFVLLVRCRLLRWDLRRALGHGRYNGGSRRGLRLYPQVLHWLSIDH